jgi:hypothetical protein
MPPKIRELIYLLKKSGYFTHPNCSMPVTLSGNPGDDAKPYQERQVQAAIEESRK